MQVISIYPPFESEYLTHIVQLAAWHLQSYLPECRAYWTGCLPFELATIRLNALVAIVRVITFQPVAVCICINRADPSSSG